MIQTLIRLPETEYHYYKIIASEQGLSLAEFFRQAARQAAGLKKHKSRRYSLFSLGTKVSFGGGPKDGSLDHDKYYNQSESRKRKPA